MLSSSDEELLISEVKLLLAEKRTYLAMFRTGVAIFGLSVTVLGVLVLGRGAHNFFPAGGLILMSIFLTIIAVAGGWLAYRSRQRIKHINELIEEIEGKNKRVAEIVV